MNYRNENATPRSRYEDCIYTRSVNQNGCRRCVQQRATECEKHTPIPSETSACRGVTRRVTPPCQRKGKCGSDNGYLHREVPIAMVYSPVQQWKELYDPHTALQAGTVFKELDLPFYPTSCKRKECSNCQYR